MTSDEALSEVQAALDAWRAELVTPEAALKQIATMMLDCRQDSSSIERKLAEVERERDKMLPVFHAVRDLLDLAHFPTREDILDFVRKLPKEIL